MPTDTQLEDARISRIDGAALERVRHVLGTDDVEIETREDRTYFRVEQKLLTP